MRGETNSTDNLSRRGAYVVIEAEGGAREASIFATGSEVVVALVLRVAHIDGYSLFSFTRASAVVNCQSALACLLFR